MKKYILFCFLLVFCFQADAEDGHRLWLRYDRIGTAVVSLPQEMSATLNIAGEELRKYYKGRKIYLRHTKDDSSVFHFEKDTCSLRQILVFCMELMLYCVIRR
jgi:alpha-glucuronidase